MNNINVMRERGSCAEKQGRLGKDEKDTPALAVNHNTAHCTCHFMPYNSTLDLMKHNCERSVFPVGDVKRINLDFLLSR